MSSNPTSQPDETEGPWYRGITGYQLIVLLIASLGWIFDIFEGQIFVTSMNEAMPSLLPENATEGAISYYNNLALIAFLLGGGTGGVVFGIVSDRIGRTRTMIVTILMYSLFTTLTALSTAPWHMIVLRFLVAMGVGGEWAVASAMIAEVFPKRARARMLGLFHASSAAGALLAGAAGAFIVGNPNLSTDQYPDLNWRLGFLVGVLPALLTLWIRMSLREPDRWVAADAEAKADTTKRTGRITDLFSRDVLRATLIGVSLATIGLATFWGVRIYGKNLMRATVERPFAETLPNYLRKTGPVLGSTPVEDLNRGDGVWFTPSGTPDLKVTKASGETYTVDLDPATHATVGDVIRAINEAAGAQVAWITEDGSAIALRDTTKVSGVHGTAVVGLGLLDPEPTDIDADGDRDYLKGTSIRPLAPSPKPAEPVLNANIDQILDLMPQPTAGPRGPAASKGEPEPPTISFDPIRRRMRKLEQLEAMFAGQGTGTEKASGKAQDKPLTAKAFLDQKFEAIKDAEMIGFTLFIVGGAVAMVAFGPLCERIGRRGAFLFFHLGGFAIAILLFKLIPEPSAALLWVALPIFGGLTGGMHAGYAVYFPELFPTRLRSTGGGFCFNSGRLIAAPVLYLSGWMQKDLGFSLENTVSILSFLFLLGVVVLFFAPETKGRELPE